MLAATDLKGSFVIDALGSIPLNLLLGFASDGGAGGTADDSEGGGNAAGRMNRQLRLLRLIKLNRMLRLSRLAKRLKSLELVLNFNPAAGRVLKLFALGLLMSFWMGCAWWFVAELELAELVESAGRPMGPNSWHPSEELLASSNMGPQVSAAFFWGVGIVTAMVPYDVEPATSVERYFTAICMFVGLVLNAFVIGSMASALSSMDRKKAIVASKLSTISAYLQIHNVAPDLRTEILGFYEYSMTSSQSMATTLRVHEDLPPALSMRLSLSVHRGILGRCPALYALSDRTLLAVLARLSPRVCAPGEIIYSEGEPYSAVYFVNRGKVLLLRTMGTSDETLVGAIGQHGNFGLHLTAEVGDEGSGSGNGSCHRSSLRRAGSSFSGSPRRASVNGCASPSPSYSPPAGVSVSLNSTSAPKLLRERSPAAESARAEMYCDLSCLNVQDLAALIAKEQLWRRLHQDSNNTSVRRRGCVSIAKAAFNSAIFVARNQRACKEPGEPACFSFRKCSLQVGPHKTVLGQVKAAQQAKDDREAGLADRSGGASESGSSVVSHESSTNQTSSSLSSLDQLRGLDSQAAVAVLKDHRKQHGLCGLAPS